MKVYFAADHAGFEYKNDLIGFVRGEMGLEVEDCGAFEYDSQDDYPLIISAAARELSADVVAGRDNRAILIGASGQGEAIVANRFPYVRAGVYYGPARNTQTDADGRIFDIIGSMRAHNDANALSLGARFISAQEAREVVRAWLVQVTSSDARHIRRTKEIDDLPAV